MKPPDTPTAAQRGAPSRQRRCASAAAGAFLPVAQARSAVWLRPGPSVPHVLRGFAREWPAVRRWTFPHLASLGPDTPVRLVLGNREHDPTRFEAATFGEYMALLQQGPLADGALPYLKEFDLLGQFPSLKADVPGDALFPRGAWVWNDVWIGPAGSRTGLHHDRLDNVAVLLKGRKRFRLVAPGTLEALGALSSKYDRVSVMASLGVDELVSRAPGTAVQEVDLEAGDVIHVPAGWWHEVVNLDASIFMSGFFGGKWGVSAKWLSTLPWHLLHRAGWWRRGDCVCHA